MKFQYFAFLSLFLFANSTATSFLDAMFKSIKDRMESLQCEAQALNKRICKSIEKSFKLKDKEYDIIERVAFHQGKDISEYKGKSLNSFNYWLAYLSSDLKIENHNIIIMIKILDSEEYKKQLGSRIMKYEDGIFYGKNGYLDRDDFSYALDMFIIESDCLEVIENFFVDCIAKILVQEFGVDTIIDDKIADWSDDRHNKRYIMRFSEKMRKEFEEYSKIEEFDAAIKKILSFTVDYYKKTRK